MGGKEKYYLSKLIKDYELDLKDKTFVISLSDGTVISLEIRPENVPHLLGIPKLALRQTYRKSAKYVYNLLKNGQITLEHITAVDGHKESYKKIMNFHRIAAMLYCGDAVKVVRQVGSIKSLYMLYIDNRPSEIVHLGIASKNNCWYPETLLVMQRNVTKYIDNQIPVDILSVDIL